MREPYPHAQDVLSLRDLYEVNLGLASPGSPISFYDVEKGIVSSAPVRPPSIIHNCDIEHTLVGEGSVLHVRPAGACTWAAGACRGPCGQIDSCALRRIAWLAFKMHRMHRNIGLRSWQPCCYPAQMWVEMEVTIM